MTHEELAAKVLKNYFFPLRLSVLDLVSLEDLHQDDLVGLRDCVGPVIYALLSTIAQLG